MEALKALDHFVAGVIARLESRETWALAFNAFLILVTNAPTEVDAGWAGALAAFWIAARQYAKARGSTHV